MSLALGVLDQSPIISGHGAATAVRETIRLAEEAEALGYSPLLAGRAPRHRARSPIPAPRSCSRASRADDVDACASAPAACCCPITAPLKVAEVFRMLEALCPGRIDLGIGRAPGGDLATAQRAIQRRVRARRRLPRAGRGPRRLSRRHAARRPSVQARARAAGSRHRAAGLAARLVGLQRRARRATSACASRSRISSTPRAATP